MYNQQTTLNNGEITVRDPNSGRFLEGNPGGGRPKGSKNFATLFNVALEKTAISHDMTSEDILVSLIVVAIKRAQAGEFRFFRDIMDRLYGKAIKQRYIADDSDRASSAELARMFQQIIQSKD